MRVKHWVVVAMLAVGMLGVAPAAAGTPQDPDFVDPCGTDGLRSNPTDGATSPWADICQGWFGTLSGAEAGLKVTATFAGPIDDDRLGYYYAEWRAGECDYQVTHDRGLGRYEAEGVFVADPGGDWLRITCGPAVEEPCPPLNLSNATCYHYPDTRHIALADSVTVDGNTVSWTLPFSGALAALAGELAEGTTLTRTRLYASNKAGVVVAGPGMCMGTTCTNVGSDFAYGRNYTVGD